MIQMRLIVIFLRLHQKQYGISYSQLKELIAQDDNAQLEWDLCSELKRNNPLIDEMAKKITPTLTSQQIDEIFIKVNEYEKTQN